jgi:hypothetical protein
MNFESCRKAALSIFNDVHRVHILTSGNGRLDEQQVRELLSFVSQIDENGNGFLLQIM